MSESEFLQYLPDLMVAFVVVLFGLMSPGPNILAVIGTSVRGGRHPGLALAMGVAVGSGLWACLAVAGLTTLLSTYANVLIVLKIVGGLYLIWLGVKSLRSAMTAKAISDQALELGQKWQVYFLRGLAIQMSNPKAAMVMLAIVSVGLTSGAPAWVSAVLIVGITLLSTIGHAIYALAFSTRSVISGYLSVRRWVEGLMGIVFSTAGVRLMMSKTE